MPPAPDTRPDNHPVLRRVGIAAGVAGVLGGGFALLARKLPPPPWHGRGKPTHKVSAIALREGFEVKDLSARSLAMVLVVLAVSAIALVSVVFGLIALFGHENHARTVPLSAEQKALLAPPGPRVQADPIADLSRERVREVRAISGYGWNDVAHSSARVPLDRAKALAVGHSLDEAP